MHVGLAVYIVRTMEVQFFLMYTFFYTFSILVLFLSQESFKTEIQDRFETLYLHVGKRLHETLTTEQISDFQPFIISLFPAVSKEWMPKSSDPREIFEAIAYNQLWDCWNYSTLEQIIKQFDDSAPEMTSLMEQYKSNLLQLQQAALVAVNVSS